MILGCSPGPLPPTPNPQCVCARESAPVLQFHSKMPRSPQIQCTSCPPSLHPVPVPAPQHTYPQNACTPFSPGLLLHLLSSHPVLGLGEGAAPGQPGSDSRAGGDNQAQADAARPRMVDSPGCTGPGNCRLVLQLLCSLHACETDLEGQVFHWGNWSGWGRGCNALQGDGPARLPLPCQPDPLAEPGACRRGWGL